MLIKTIPGPLDRLATPAVGLLVVVVGRLVSSEPLDPSPDPGDVAGSFDGAALAGVELGGEGAS